MALNPAEEVEVESPATEEEVTEEEAAAEPETEQGVTEEEPGELEDEDDLDAPKIPRRRLNEVASQRDQYKQEAEYYKQLVQNPQALQTLTGEDESRFLAPGEVLLPEKAADEFYEELDYIRYNNERAQQQYRIQQAKSQAVESQQKQYQAQQQAIQDFTNTLDALAKSDNVALTEADLAAIREQGEILELGYIQKRKSVSYADLAKQAYNLVRPQLEAGKEKAKLAAKTQRTEQVLGQKKRVVSGQVGTIGGASVAAEKQFKSPQEAMEAAYREAYGE